MPDLEGPGQGTDHGAEAPAASGFAGGAEADKDLIASGRGRPYFDTFDGVRAFAVAAVVAFHTGLHPFKNGFLGVDVFFVLSGFLITSLLLDELRRSRALNKKAFFERRALRILPAMVVVCVACVGLAYVADHHFTAVLAGAVFTLLGVANIWHYSGHPTYLLDQTWTLSIEEQFYFLWPFLLLVAWRARRTGRLVILAGSLALWALLVLVPLHGAAAHVRFTYVRANGLALGCLLALFLPQVRRLPKAVLTVGCWAAAAFLVLSVVVPAVPNQIFSSWRISMGSVAALVLLAGLVLARPAVLVAGLTAGVVRWLGLRSYAVYLWHFPLLSIFDTHARHIPHAVRTVSALVATLVLAELSWRLIESPALRRKRRFEPGAQRPPRAERPRPGRPRSSYSPREPDPTGPRRARWAGFEPAPGTAPGPGPEPPPSP